MAEFGQRGIAKQSSQQRWAQHRRGMLTAGERARFVSAASGCCRSCSKPRETHTIRRRKKAAALQHVFVYLFIYLLIV